ncbi:fimbrial protein [Klebsiella aerogenes]|nr:fimbrial protein [Klebsiella aerogenes]
MNINYKILSGILLALISGHVLAEEDNAGTIHFSGEIVSPSCTMEDGDVSLGTIAPSYFDVSGKESAMVPFTITLSGCPLASDGLAAVQLTFNGPTVSEDVNLLAVSKISTTAAGDDAATGVGIALSEDGNDNELIPMDGSEGHIWVGLPTVDGSNVSANFNARYKSYSATVTPGPADADMTVNILYH